MTLLSVVFISLHSCKKGDGDPFISLLSRKARLTGEWKVSTLTSTFKYNNKTTETTFDGLNKTVVYTVKDSTTADTVFTYVTTDKYTGEITTDYKKDGSYYYSETFQHVESGNVTNVEISGNWYFMGENIQNKYKNKELLAMQVNNSVYNIFMGLDYSTIYQGTNSLDILEIYQLKNKEIILKVNKTETIDFVKYTTTMQYTLIPR
jgi:hypothetical protein